MKAISACVIAFSLTPAASAHTALRSYFPATHLPEFLLQNLDLASFRNSLGPKRQNGRTFSALGLAPSKVTSDAAEFDGPDWFYKIRVLKRGDTNGDGLEDLEICFTDSAKQGSYSSQEALLVTRYSSSMLAVALHYEVSGC